MFRLPFALMLLLCLAPVASAQKGSVWLSLSPADLPRPTLEHRLILDRRELLPGNVAALYYYFGEKVCRTGSTR